MTTPLRILHLITELNVGGAEVMLSDLVSRMDRGRVQSTVVSLGGLGPVGDEIAAQGIPVHAVDMPRGPGAVAHLPFLWRLVRATSPHVLQCWLYHAGLVGLAVGRAAGVRTVVWSIQNDWLDPALSRVSTRVVARASAPLSMMAAALVSPSHVALQSHLERGYRNGVVRVIPNGFDLRRFRPDPAARVALRRELHLPPDALLIGLVARWDPQKDHETFLRAAGRLVSEPGSRDTRPHFILCGLNVDQSNHVLGRIAAEAGLGQAVRFLGLRRDMPHVAAALDIAVSSSAGQEAFPLVIGEAMACGVPCVVTSVGDSPVLVGETGIVVPPRDPGAMAAAWASLIAEGPDARQARGKPAASRFDIERVAREYEDLYESLAYRSRIFARSKRTVASAE